MRVGVFGSGAIGGYFGALMAWSGHQVAFVARGRQLEALQSAGLTVRHASGDRVLSPVEATSDPTEIGPCDLILLGVKVWQVPEAARAMAPMVGPDTAILPLQNGVETPQLLAAELGHKPVLGGLCKVIVNLVAPGVIEHIGVEPQVVFGELDNQRSERVEIIAQALRDAGCQVTIPASIQTAMWEKFLFISTVSGIGAVTRSPVGVLRELPGTRKMLEQCMTEIIAVGRAHDVPFDVPKDTNVVQRWMSFLDGIPADATASMQRDLMEGRPSELEAQNGAVVRLGQQVGVPTPLNDFIYNALLPMERASRGLHPA